jgi:hypothetical protein
VAIMNSHFFNDYEGVTPCNHSDGRPLPCTWVSPGARVGCTCHCSCLGTAYIILSSSLARLLDSVAPHGDQLHRPGCSSMSPWPRAEPRP